MKFWTSIFIIIGTTCADAQLPINGSALPIHMVVNLQVTSLALGYAMLVCCVLGAFGNVLSIRIFSHVSMRSSVNVLLIGLSAVDLFMLLLVIPVFVLPCLNAFYDKESIATAISYITAIVYPFTIMAQSSSIWTFVAITVERYVAVCLPLKANSLCTIGNARKALATVYTASVLYNLIRFGEYRLQWTNSYEIFYNRLFDNFTAVPRGVRVEAVKLLRDDYYYNWIYFNGMYLITHFLVPFSVLLIFNFLMICSILRAKAKRRHLSRKEKTEYKTTVMMCVVILAFLLCNTLPMVLNLLEHVFYPNLFGDPHTIVIGYLLNDVCNLMVVVNSTINFVTYFVFSQKYRRLLKALFDVNIRFSRFNTDSRSASITAITTVDSRYDLEDMSNVPAYLRVSRFYERRMAFSARNPKKSKYYQTKLSVGSRKRVINSLDRCSSSSAS